jgi:hypothetical protein
VAYDRSAALEWCKREASAFLTVDWGAFEDYVTKSKTPPSIVTFEEAPQATIATDLRKALLEAEGLAF